MPKHTKHEEPEDLIDGEPPVIEPYAILGIEKSATEAEIKKAYRKAALKHHPDKAAEDLKDEAHSKFQEVAFAYAVLSDPKRRKRYDTTGSTAESMSADGDFSWTEFYSEQFKDIITPEIVESFAKSYKGSPEEKDDLLAAYEKFRGSWQGIYETVMLSNPLEDEERYSGIIDEAIKTEEVKSYKAYTQESAQAKEKRMKAARREHKEAGEEVKKMNSKKKGGKKDNSLDSLAALIKGKQAQRAGFFDHLESKYGAMEDEKPTRGKKRAAVQSEEEPSEEQFQAAAAKLAKAKKIKQGKKAKKAKKAKARSESYDSEDEDRVVADSVVDDGVKPSVKAYHAAAERLKASKTGGEANGRKAKRAKH